MRIFGDSSKNPATKKVSRGLQYESRVDYKEDYNTKLKNGDAQLLLELLDYFAAQKKPDELEPSLVKTCVNSFISQLKDQEPIRSDKLVLLQTINTTLEEVHSGDSPRYISAINAIAAFEKFLDNNPEYRPKIDFKKP